MMHKPIVLQDLGLSFSHKTCFENFNARILPGSRIAIIGRNGSGKSSLLNILQNKVAPTEGTVVVPNDVQIAYVPQHINGEASGGECFNLALSEALNVYPDVLLLAEPTNHLDKTNRQSLLRLLHEFEGTLIVVSHDVELLRKSVDIFWHIEQERIHVFQGHYDDYVRECERQRHSLEEQKSYLNRQKKEMHQSLMQEQQRAAKSKEKGEKSIANRKWATVGSKTKAARGNTTSVNKKSVLRNEKHDLTDQLSQLYIPEIITPRFSLNAATIKKQMLVNIDHGCVAYTPEKPVLTSIHLSIASGDRVALCGDNGSGKSSLIKAILSDITVIRSGEWLIPKPADIGYVDQHYATLIDTESVLDAVQKLVPTWTMLEIRRHLTDFLFFNNEEVIALASSLSGGEKARLCLAQIAALTPKLLILDEVTNNLDLESRAHVIQVLKAYPGALLVISHDEDFLQELEIIDCYIIQDGIISLKN